MTTMQELIESGKFHGSPHDRRHRLDALSLIKQEAERAGGNGKLADLLGFNPSFLSDVLNGRRGISLELAYRLEARLGVDGLAILHWQTGKDWERHKASKSGN